LKGNTLSIPPENKELWDLWRFLQPKTKNRIFGGVRKAIAKSLFSCWKHGVVSSQIWFLLNSSLFLAFCLSDLIIILILKLIPFRINKTCVLYARDLTKNISLRTILRT